MTEECEALGMPQRGRDHEAILWALGDGGRPYADVNTDSPALAHGAAPRRCSIKIRTIAIRPLLYWGDQLDKKKAPAL